MGGFVLGFLRKCRNLPIKITKKRREEMDWNSEGGGGGPSSLWIGAEAWMDGW